VVIFFKILYLLGVLYLAFLCGREVYSTHSGTSAFCFTMMMVFLPRDVSS